MIGNYFIYAICIVIGFILLALGWKIIAIFFLSLYNILSYLIRIIIWRFSKSKYIGRMCLYNKQRRKIVGETFECVKLKGINGKEFGNKKIGYKLIKKTDILLID